MVLLVHDDQDDIGDEVEVEDETDEGIGDEIDDLVQTDDEAVLLLVDIEV